MAADGLAAIMFNPKFWLSKEYQAIKGTHVFADSLIPKAKIGLSKSAIVTFNTDHDELDIDPVYDITFP